MNWRKSKYGVAAAILVSGAHGTGVDVWESENQKIIAKATKAQTTATATATALVVQEQEQQHDQGRDLSELL